MSGWNPEQYLKYADHRLRPAIDLLNRIDMEAPRLVYDLGCGAGNVTRLLRQRWPDAEIIGVDSSTAMLNKARAADPSIHWLEADLARWRAAGPADVIFSNAALQWLDDHEILFPALLDSLAAGGTLAVQMPRNHQAPSHQGMAEAARSGPWANKLAPLLRESPVQPPEALWDIIAQAGGRAEIWETEYLHPLEGPDAVVQWTLGTALKPLLDALEEPWRGKFLADYTARMDKAYPRRADGVTLFPFRRQFLLAQR
jgi:trans-aconitate 2-methyltransferase